MKILYIITTGGTGGAQKYVLELAKHFNGTIAVGTEQAELIDEAEKLAIPITKLSYMKRAFNPVWDVMAFLELLRVISKSGADIVHTNSTKAGILGSIASKVCGKKTVYTVHGLSQMNIGSTATKSITILIEKFATLFRDKLITVSDYDKNFLLANKVCSAKKVRRVYNGITERHFLDKDLAKQTLSIPDDKVIIGTIARFQHLKGIDLLIGAFSLLPSGLQQSSQLVLIGNGPDKEKIETLIDKLNLKQSVMMLGQHPDAAKFLKAFDIIVSPSRLEGFPFGLLEAMQSGVPILATNVGGVLELLGEGGLLAEPNPESISQKLSELLQNKQLQSRISQESISQSKKFSNQSMIAETEKVYQSL